MDRGRLARRVAVVTGAGSGIGRATALRFAAEGASVIVNDIAAEGAAQTVDDIERLGGRAVVQVGDVGDSAYVDSLVAGTARDHGRLDVLHNNAGYGRPGLVADVDDESFDDVVRVNLYGVFHGTRAALRVMVEQGGGSIINTASNAGLGAAIDRGPYGAAKAAVINLTKSTAVEYGRYGVRANAICPGPIATPAFERYAPDLGYYAAQIPLRRLGQADDVAALAAFLASDDSAYISGVAIPVDGAMMARIPSPFLTPEDVTS